MTGPLRGRAEVGRLRRQLDEVFSRINSIDESQLELRSDLARYLCVLVSGYIEKSIRELAHHLSRRTASPSVASYVGTQLGFFQNAKSESILKLVGSFDPTWRQQLELNFSDELQAVNSVVGNRHQIAHGGTASVSYAWIKEYYDRVQVLVEELEEMFDPR